MNQDELERLGPDSVRLLLETGYFRDLDGRQDGSRQRTTSAGTKHARPFNAYGSDDLPLGH
jgi:hypothetical protein